MNARDFCIIALAICCTILSVGHCMQELKITNLERQLQRIEYDYQVVLAENEKMVRLNDQTLQLMTGGWDAVVSSSSDN